MQLKFHLNLLTRILMCKSLKVIKTVLEVVKKLVID